MELLLAEGKLTINRTFSFFLGYILFFFKKNKQMNLNFSSSSSSSSH